MTITEILERAHQHTGRKLEGKGVDERGLVIGCLQDICTEQRWPWRRKWATFTSVAGTATYDLTATAYGNADDLEELISIVRVDSATSMFELEPITDGAKMIVAQHQTTQADPSQYFLEPGTEATVHLTDIPNAAKTYRYVYWAIPNPATDDTAETIPLLPSKYHRVLLQYVTAMFWSLLPGEGVAGPNASQAFQMYLRQLELMKGKGQFSTGEARFFKSRERAVSSH